jgi:hypothetical protein
MLTYVKPTGNDPAIPTHRIRSSDRGRVVDERFAVETHVDEANDVYYYQDERGGTYVDRPGFGVEPTNDAALRPLGRHGMGLEAHRTEENRAAALAAYIARTELTR